MTPLHGLRVVLDVDDHIIGTTNINGLIRELYSVMIYRSELNSCFSASSDYFAEKFKEIYDERTELHNRLRDQIQIQTITQ